jgi:superfamily II DNA/RNA helicase
MKMLAAFRNNEITYLIASDVAARGLDIPEVSHVFNYDVPIHSEDYVHRIGRTGRAGRAGHSFTMVTKEETKYLKAIEALIKKDVAWFDPGIVIDEAAEAEAPRQHGRGRGRGAERQSRKPERRETPEPKAEKPRPEPRRESAGKTPAATKAPKPEARPPQPQASKGQRRRDQHDDDGPDHKGFHAGNMPAFLSKR